MIRLRLLFGLYSLSIFAVSVRAQDMAVRVEAVQLLEHANKVSMVAGTPVFRTDVTFHAYSVDGTRSDGAFHRIFSPDGQWIESIYPPIHAVAIFTPSGVIQNKYEPPPPQLREALSLLPVRLVRFDQSDIIHSVSDASVLGRAARCIAFDTINGKSTAMNELCVDNELGTLVRWHIGDETIENSDFFTIGNVWFPHQIRQYINGKLRMEEEQNGSLIEGPFDLMSLAPPDPQILYRCKQFRRAIGRKMPQPDDAGPGPWYDVEVHVVIFADGRVHEASVLPKGRPDLEKEAVRLVQTWQYDAATCEGKPVLGSGVETVHFRPQ